MVTGGTGAIGRACVELLAERGARVFATDILEEPSPFENSSISQLRHDVSEAQEWDRVVETILDKCGRLDVLVNNAAIFHMTSLQDTLVDDMDATYAANQRAVYLGMKTAAEPMIAAGKGAIVNIASAAALRGYPVMFPYGTSKWHVRGMTKYAAIDLARSGVRVNSIVPGVIDTPAQANNSPEAFEQMLASIPFGRMGTAREVANAVAFLASDEASYITGAELSVCGGITA
tara:strand:- start:2669 stop:3364 length:696 start_codon:yes stop_codon:yes gene_type:complete